MNPPVFFIVGKPQHGKSTLRNAISQRTRLRGGSCSDVVYALLAARRNVSVESLRAIPKEQLRPDLIRFGDWLCRTGEPLAEVSARPGFDEDMYRHPTALVRVLVLSGIHVIDGVRRRIELQEAKDRLEWIGLQTLTLFVDRPGGPDIKDNTEDLRDLADELVLNDGTIEDLERKAGELLQRRFPASGPEPQIVTSAPTSVLRGA